jgi:hypothetical protein
MLAKLFFYQDYRNQALLFQPPSSGKNLLEESPKIAQLFLGDFLFTGNRRSHSIRILNVRNEHKDLSIIF